MRIRGRVDDNQEAIVKKFRGAGYSVAITSSLGNGFPDLVVGKHGVNILVEVKDGSKSPSKRKLTDDEYTFHQTWRGAACVIESEEDVEELDSWLRDTYPNLSRPTDLL